MLVSRAKGPPSDGGSFDFPGTKAVAIALLILVELTAFGPFLPKLGFYHDDWVFLELFSRQSGYWSCVQAMWARNFGIRPVDVLLFPAFYFLGGLKPLVYHILLLCLDGLGGCLLFLLLNGILEDAPTAAAAAGLAMIYPAHSATHHWFANAPQTFAADLALASLLMHRRWLASRGSGFLGASMALYLLAMLTYESVAFFPLILGAGILLQRPLRAAGAALAPYGAALALAILWEKVGAQALFHIPNPKATAFSPIFFLKEFWTAADCLTMRSGALLGRAFNAVGMGALALAALGGAVAGLWRARRPRWREALLLSAAAFAAAYAPYAATGTYLPQIAGAMSRVNGGGGIAAGLALAALIGLRPAAGRALLGVFTAAFLCADWYVAGQWAKAYASQKAAFEGLASKARGVPGPAVVILQGVSHVDDALDYVSGEDWGLTSAVELLTKRQDLVVVLITPWMRPDQYGVVEQAGSQVLRVFPRRNLYSYDFSKDALFLPVKGP